MEEKKFKETGEGEDKRKRKIQRPMTDTDLLLPGVRVVEVVSIWFAGMVYSSYCGENSHLVVASWKWVEHVFN